MFARQAHPNHIRGTQPLKHQVVINVQYTEYEALDELVLILSKRRENEQKGQLMNQKIMVVVTRRSSFTREDATHLLRTLMMKRNKWNNGHNMSYNLQIKIL